MEKVKLEEKMIKSDNEIKDFVKQIGAKSHKFDVHFSIIMDVLFPNTFSIEIIFEDGHKYGQSSSSFRDCFDKIVESVCWGQNKPNPYPKNNFSLNWKKYPEEKPTEYGEYWVYRNGCGKLHKETWNNTGWAYNNNDITHFTTIIKPKV